MKAFVVILGLACLVSAQTRRRAPSEDSGVRQVNLQGAVRELGDREVSIELKDSRIVTFKVTASTRFNDGLSLKTLQPDDRVVVQGTQDQEGYFFAATISLDAAATAADARKVRQTGDNAQAQAPANQGNTVLRKPAVADPDDGGPPVLRRGKPAQRADQTEAIARSAPRDNLPADSSLKGVRDRPVDEYPAATGPSPNRPRNLSPKQELLERAREWALTFTDNLPNYVCQQFTTRYVRIPGNREWQARDVVSANVVYENGKEDYRNLAINGKPVNKKMEEMPGSWSTGEFGTTLRSLFHPYRQAEFTFVKQTTINGLSAWVYDYKVRKENSDWRISLGSQSIIPAYNGRVWIEEKTAQVLRIEMSATEIPAEFPLDQVESANDYGFVRLATADQYMLPTHAETLSCERGSPLCSRNTIDFRNYHKYSGEANITFDK